MKTMQLSELLQKDIEKDINITGLTADSRDVKPGMLFAALPGAKINGRDFIDQAIESGAVAILTTAEPVDTLNSNDIHIINHENPRQLFARMAARLHPDQPPVMVAVTGSNGKSSIVNFCRQIWQKLDYNAASLGTVGIEAPGIIRDGTMTTPDPVTLHAELEELEAAGITHLAMEASSHGLDQYRLEGITLSAAGFTNLTRDHLDYHGSMDRYLAAKSRLFSELLATDGTAVLNADIPEFKSLKKICQTRGIRVLDYGYQAEALKILDREILPEGQQLKLRIMGEDFDVALPLVGEFQAFNALCALGLVIGSLKEVTLRPFEAITWLEHLQGVRGRMERVGMHPNQAAVYVDYAHTPDGLENILNALRPHAQGKLRLIFGCGGDRDTGKRPLMGEIAERLADQAILTDDNPRTEDPAAIRAEVKAACPHAIEIDDRKKAISHGIASLEKGDILVIAGKGHERGQTIGTETLPFDDAKVARSILNTVGETP
jgi:UDP-N-acetylmuramoyl-L-alanyl-D-glutamate--2,6-diaminopimelate ligase